MRIAIVTLSLHTNYGGIMQAFALQHILSAFGHEVEHLQQKVITSPLHSKWLMPLVYVKRLCWKYVLGDSEVRILEDPRMATRRYTDQFIKKNITIKYLNDDDWNSTLASLYDMIIVGSDQVWRPCYSKPLSRAFLDFTSGVKIRRIAYGVSFGTEMCEYSDAQILESKALISDFDLVTVREDSAILLCKAMWGIDAMKVLDPTLLLTRSVYDKLISDVQGQFGDVFVYVLDESPLINDRIVTFAKNRCWEISKILLNGEGEDVPLVKRIKPPVEVWLKSFKEAKFVITDSFHACVFSIIYNKPFITLGNSKRGMTRFESLLSNFGLRHCYFDTDSNNVIQVPDIDWDIVNKKLEEDRESSLGVLFNAIRCSI